MQKAGAALVLVLSLVLLLMSAPRMVSGLLFTLAPATSERPSPPQPDAQTLAQIDWAQRVAWSSDVALYQALAMHLGTMPPDLHLIETLLARSPLRPNAWLYLTGLRSAGGQPQGALSAWRMSVFAGRIEPYLMAERLEAGLALVPVMGTDDLRMLDEQIQLSFILRPAHVSRLMAQPRNEVHAPRVKSAVERIDPVGIDQIIRIYGQH